LGFGRLPGGVIGLDECGAIQQDLVLIPLLLPLSLGLLQIFQGEGEAG
jgi:hypothetical protein